MTNEAKQSSMKSLLFYLATVTAFSAASINEYIIVTENRFDKIGFKNQRKFGGPFKYLTIINLMIDNIYFLLTLLFVLSKSNNERGKLKRSIDFIYTRLAFPLGGVS